MSRFLAPLLLLSTACGGPSFDGLWLFQFEATPNVETDTTCDENFTDARCRRAEAGGEDGPWTVEQDGSLSDGLRFAEMVQGAGNTGWLVWDGLIIPVTRDGATIRGSYAGSTDTARTETHESGYRSSLVQVAETDVEVLLEPDADGAWAGEITRTSSSTTDWEESDEWDPQEVGRFSSTMTVFTETLVASDDEGETGGVGFSGNRPESDDCGGNVCRGSLIEEGSLEIEVIALPTFGERDPGAGGYDAPLTPGGGNWSD
jgi:hypothetical protein